jgi:hypothetical protein
VIPSKATFTEKLGAVEVRPSAINGVGVFALADFAAGEVITREDDSFVVTPENPLPEGEHEYHCDWYADGRQVLLPVPERHINHSCDFNSIVMHIDGTRYTVARGDIASGDEITHNYCIDGFGDIVWRCNCGSANCLRDIPANFFELPMALQIEYLPYLGDVFRRVYADKVAEVEAKAAAS